MDISLKGILQFIAIPSAGIAAKLCWQQLCNEDYCTALFMNLKK